MANNQNNYVTMAQAFIMANKGKIPNTPWSKNAVNAIMNGDDEAGMKISNNLCQSMGITQDEAIKGGLNIIQNNIGV